MKYRRFGKTDLLISEIGFGAWGIGGPAMAGKIPIGWGEVKDDESRTALNSALSCGINFYDTADFYGFGHSEELIGEVFGNRKDVIIATKVGQRLATNQSIFVDYSKAYIIRACEASLKRLRRDTIDYYQLHTAKRDDLQRGECIEAMRVLKEQGKIRYWGLSLNTYYPEDEAEYLISKAAGDGFQLVLNLINQRALPLIRKAAQQGYGLIARMPLQFGLLTGKFDSGTIFNKNDHRSFRFTPTILERSMLALDEIWPLVAKYGISKTALSLSFILGFPEISTVIPGMKTKEQVRLNAQGSLRLSDQDQQALIALYEESLSSIVDLMEREG